MAKTEQNKSSSNASNNQESVKNQENQDQEKQTDPKQDQSETEATTNNKDEGLPTVDIAQFYQERENEQVDPDKFSGERQGTENLETEDEFEEAGKKETEDEEPEETEDSGTSMEYYFTKASLNGTSYLLSNWHQKKVFTADERKKIKKLRRNQDQNELEEDDKKLLGEWQAVKKEEKEELTFDKEEIEMIADPLAKALAKSRFKMKAEYAVIFCVLIIMWPRIQYVISS